MDYGKARTLSAAPKDYASRAAGLSLREGELLGGANLYDCSNHLRRVNNASRTRRYINSGPVTITLRL
jgi:hypothetical protein